ncbi:Uncharacterised protein [Bacteroides eggerthii]|uniref:Uncharacterized protein n=1 Tax=Bacteroides eggerthii TaxID=28111 RepID=A0A380YJW5_9BACE|nr:Uncharacterised protein [Bacteroides eggerthii]
MLNTFLYLKFVNLILKLCVYKTFYCIFGYPLMTICVNS